MPTNWRSMLTSAPASLLSWQTPQLHMPRFSPDPQMAWLSGSGSTLGFPFSPKPDEFKELAGTLNFLKFDKEQVETLYNMIGSGIKIASVAGAIVGAYDTTKKLLEAFGVLESDNEKITAMLQDLGWQVGLIHARLNLQERKGLSEEAGKYRANEGTARQSRWSAATSRSPDALKALQWNADILFGNVWRMLDITQTEGISNQEITFLRESYQKNSYDVFQYCTFPFVSGATGAVIPNYAHRSSNGTTTIWDPGHYIDVLLSSIKELLLCYGTLEPGFRSTCHYVAGLKDISNRMKEFITKWKEAILVANPAACIAADGRIVNGYDPAPIGILVGAIDPVTGITNLRLCGDFQQRLESDWTPFANGNMADRVYAVDPQHALQASLSVHENLVRAVEKACGLNTFIALQRKIEMLSQDASWSQFVNLQSATFKKILARAAAVADIAESDIFGEDMQVGLGKLDEYADVRGQTWPAKRFRQVMQKQFRFRMARRAEVSGKRIGYRLRVGGEEIVLVRNSFSAGSSDNAGDKFPIDRLRRAELQVNVEGAHCCQLSRFSKVREDRFERGGFDEARALVAHRPSQAKFIVEVDFEPFSKNDELAFTGDAIVTVTNVDPSTYEDSYELSIQIIETVFTEAGPAKEIIADSMTIYMMPSFLIVDKSFIDAYRKALENMMQSIKHLDFKFKQLVTEIGPPNPLEEPEWNKNRILAVNRGIQYINSIVQLRPDEMAKELNDLLVPHDLKQHS